LVKKIKNAEAILKLSEKAGIDPQTRQAMIAEVLKADYFLEGKTLSRQITGFGGPPFAVSGRPSPRGSPGRR